MAATLIASRAASGITPKAIHAGEQSVYSIYSLTATLSAGDIIQMCRIPDGCRVTGVELISDVNLFAMAGVVNVGTRGTPTLFLASVTPSANLRFTINNASGFGYLLDLSDDAEPKSSMVELKVTTSGTGTKSGAISLIVKYIMDQAST